jgi:uncharacterized protein YbjT (DUF2867 family)
MPRSLSPSAGRQGTSAPPAATVAIAGAGGFVGRHLVARLRGIHPLLALGRAAPGPAEGEVTWRRADLFSAGSTRAALQGADVAVYLVHSMMPSSRLFQGSFHDTDLLLADNFARGCARAGVRRILYLGGLVPEHGYVSPHLESRREVEGVLRATGLPVTVLRAGMIVGPGGSSFAILRSLVELLPVMVLPRWTQSQAQAVHVDDVVEVLARAVDDEAFAGQTVDVVNGERITYEALLREMAAALGLRRWMVRVPIASTGFSKRWVQLFGRSSRELVSPLIDSLLCDLPQLPPGPLVAGLIRYPTFRTMLVEMTAASPAPAPTSRRAEDRSVRSVQRLPRVPGHDARWIADEYLRWLPRFLRSLLRAEARGRRVEFTLFFLRAPLLILEFVDEPEAPDRAKLHVVGGLLTRSTTSAWLEFRQVDHRAFTLSALHEFVPALPWPLYRLTQAPVHAWVMASFGRHLARAQDLTGDGETSQPPSP